MKTTRNRPLFHVGDQVRIDLGQRKVSAVVREDRGNLGVGGRRLYRVEIPMDPFDPMTTELPEDEMEAIPPGTEKKPVLEKEKVIAYLINGGLLSILRSNLAGGKYQPHVWLCLDNLGNITHTFADERGLVGGQRVPSQAIGEFKIARAKQNQVIAYVETFGLNRAEAEQVVFKVGTAP